MNKCHNCGKKICENEPTFSNILGQVICHVCGLTKGLVKDIKIPKIPKLIQKPCLSCGIGTSQNDGFPRDAGEEDYCWICICRGKARVEPPKKVYLVYYSCWHERLPKVMAVKSTKDKANAFITDAIANDTSLSDTIDNFYVDEWDLE